MIVTKINVLNPVLPEKQLKPLAECMTGNGLNHLHILDVGASHVLVDLLYERQEDEYILNRERFQQCLELADKAWRSLYEQCISDRQRILCLTFLIKAILSPMLEEEKK
ncbi:MAG: hypothetical protein PWP72_585 [Thermoanaerobacter sp.]|jgi:hypothetical protein|nr:hypothetical protein [Thermoanaerobacter sp.]